MTAKFDRKKGLKCTAHNERFGVIGGVCPPESLWDFASFVPRTSVSEPPTTPSRHHVGCNALAAHRTLIRLTLTAQQKMEHRNLV